MRTRNIFRYLIAIIIALGTTVNAMAQQRNLKIYFNQYTEGATGDPIMLVTDDNNAYDLPAGVTVSAQGVAWAKDARFFEWISQDVNDRLLADYLRDENGNYYTDEKGNIYKKESHLKLSFTNFPYEVNMIQWNKMNDLLSGSITDFFKNYGITTTCVPVSGSGFSYSEEHWAMNLFTHNATFSRTNIPWKKENNKNVVLNGLTSFEINEAYDTKVGIGNWTWIDLGLSELSNKCRTFIKAGWNGKTGTSSNIKDSDTKNWAFKVQFTLPDIRMRCYNTTTGAVDNNIMVGKPSGTYKLKGYITAHAGAVVPTENPVNPEDFHFEYEADPNKMVIRKTSGVIELIKVSGDIPVTVKLMRGERLVCSYTQTIHVYSVDPTRPEIAIGFRNGYKGYDLTAGSNISWIEGYITKYGKDKNNNEIIVTPTNNINDYHYVYSESSNGQIIKIDSITGQIKPQKEGDVEISAVLKNGTEVVSNIYTYALHVFGKNEGLTWTRSDTYHYTITTWLDNWKIVDQGLFATHTYNNSSEYEWKQPVKKLDNGQTIPYLNANISISENSNSPSGAGADNWKQIAWFKTGSYKYWRAVCQKISFKMMVPKYSKADGTFAFAGNVTIGETNKGDCIYGLEVKDLGMVSSSTATTRIEDINWETLDADETPTSYSGTTTLARKGAYSYTSYVGDGMSGFSWSHDNSNGSESANPIRYLAVMAYLHRDYSYPGEFSVGYKGIPTYTYYATLTYYNNDGTGNVWETQNLTSTSKTETKQMYNGAHNLPTRDGYEFLGWSTDPNATIAEYKGKGDSFCPYDAVNGGGKGPVSLYAVWNKLPDIVTLDPQGGTGGNTQTTALYGEKLPNGLTAPTKEGYEFKGYYSNQNQEHAEATGQDYGGTQYYDKDMVGVTDWDYTYSGVTIYAHWAPATFTVTLDAAGGVFPENVVSKNIGNFDIAKESNSVMTIAYKYKFGKSNTLVSAEAKKPGYELLGWFDENGVKVIEASELDRNCKITDNGGYWIEDGLKYNHAGNLTLTAHYRKKYKYADNVITFGKDENGNPEKVEAGDDWLYSVVNDLVGAAQDVYENEPGHPQTMVFDLRESINRWYTSYDCQEVMEDLQKPEYSEFISPNLLVYFNANSWNDDKCYNAVTLDNTCKDLRVTDRYSIKIPTAFNANEASYARDANVAANDSAKVQAENSTWGTLCLPYPTKNNTNGVRFYELKSMTNNYMEFSEMPKDTIIPANTPVLYNRTDGGVGSQVKIDELNVEVPINYTSVTNDYMSVTKSYSDADASIHDWEFRGNLKTTVFYGKGYVGLPSGAQILPGDVYYFKQNKFTYLNPKMEKNGKTYKAAKMTLYPYRAYFYRNTGGSYYSSTKVSAYSILVIGEDGTTLDITNAILGDGEGDGKIYDLNGIRVMQPVKGRLYIVNGQKKVYR